MITSSDNTDQQPSLRKIAILVATLDEPLAERLLADLPAREAAAVQQIVEQLDDVDPAEYRAVVADFRQGVVESPPHGAESQPRQLDGVELDESLLARMSTGETYQASPLPVGPIGSWHACSDIDVAPLIEMLSVEQPQTIAVVLSRLETERAAELIGELPPTLQAEVLLRLADLDPADEQALEVVESQLAEWINDQRQRQQRMTAGRDLVQRILQNTPVSQRVTLLSKLRERDPGLAESLSQRSQEIPPDQNQPHVYPAMASQAGETSPQQTRNEPQERSLTPATLHRQPGVSPATSATGTAAIKEAGDPISELEALDDQSLLRGLQRADRQTVMLALAGASEGLMKRIVKGLPRRRAKKFRQQVRAIGPTRLSDMLAAQRELLRCSQAF